MIKKIKTHKLLVIFVAILFAIPLNLSAAKTKVNGNQIQDYLLYMTWALNKTGGFPSTAETMVTLDASAVSVAQKYNWPQELEFEVEYFNLKSCPARFDNELRVSTFGFEEAWADLADVFKIKNSDNMPKILFRGFRYKLVKNESSQEGLKETNQPVNDLFVIEFPEGAQAKVGETGFVFSDGKWKNSVESALKGESSIILKGKVQMKTERPIKGHDFVAHRGVKIEMRGSLWQGKRAIHFYIVVSEARDLLGNEIKKLKGKRILAIGDVSLDSPEDSIKGILNKDLKRLRFEEE